MAEEAAAAEEEDVGGIATGPPARDSVATESGAGKEAFWIPRVTGNPEVAVALGAEKIDAVSGAMDISVVAQRLTISLIMSGVS